MDGARVQRNDGSAEAELPRDPDGVLARRIAAGDVQAWDQFYAKYFNWAYRFAYWHLNGRHADAEDLCCDILMAAAQSIGGFDARRGTLEVWLLGRARHRLARFCRKRRLDLPLIAEAASSTDGAELAYCGEFQRAGDWYAGVPASGSIFVLDLADPKAKPRGLRLGRRHPGAHSLGLPAGRH